MNIVITNVPHGSWIRVQTRFSFRAWWIIDQITEEVVYKISSHEKS